MILAVISSLCKTKCPE